jgi:hypothetical protein
VYEKDADQMLVDRAGKASGLSKEAYASKVMAIDEEYAGLLDIVLKEIHSTAGLGPT